MFVSLCHKKSLVQRYFFLQAKAFRWPSRWVHPLPKWPPTSRPLKLPLTDPESREVSTIQFLNCSTTTFTKCVWKIICLYWFFYYLLMFKILKSIFEIQRFRNRSICKVRSVDFTSRLVIWNLFFSFATHFKYLNWITLR